jgi:hypothetical protein
MLGRCCVALFTLMIVGFAGGNPAREAHCEFRSVYYVARAYPVGDDACDLVLVWPAHLGPSCTNHGEALGAFAKFVGERPQLPHLLLRSLRSPPAMNEEPSMRDYTIVAQHHAPPPNCLAT